jgi:hypothetical protein
MSKKSRRRNKKILAALALAGGAAMFGRRKKNALGDTGSLSGKAGFEGMDYLAPTKKPVVLKQKKPVLFAPNKTANPNAIPHKEIFDAVHGNPISGGTFNKDPGWIDVKKKIEVLKNSGAPKKVIRNELMEYVTNSNNQNYAIKQEALKRARGTDYSVSGRKPGPHQVESNPGIFSKMKNIFTSGSPFPSMARGGRITLKSGGRVRGVGIAKRGFSKTLRKK